VRRVALEAHDWWVRCALMCLEAHDRRVRCALRHADAHDRRVASNVSPLPSRVRTNSCPKLPRGNCLGEGGFARVQASSRGLIRPPDDTAVGFLTVNYHFGNRQGGNRTPARQMTLGSPQQAPTFALAIGQMYWARVNCEIFVDRRAGTARCCGCWHSSPPGR